MQFRLPPDEAHFFVALCRVEPLPATPAFVLGAGHGKSSVNVNIILDY